MATNTVVLPIDSLVRVSRVNGRDLKSDRIQRDGNEHVIEGHGYRLGRHVEALNVSGGLVASSDQWQQVLQRVRDGLSAGAAVNYIHRLSRDVASGLAWIDDLGAAGGVLIGGGRIIDLTNPHERHMLIAELNNSELALNIYKVSARETMVDVKKRGILNRLPFGYLRLEADNAEGRDPKTLVPHPERAKIVKLIFTLRANGERWSTIITKLHDLGVASPKGAPYWTESTLGSIVRNRVYLGEVEMGRRTDNPHVTRDAHEALVEPELFKAAQSTDRRVWTGRNVGGVAHGLVSCSGCGRPLQVQRGGHDRLFYGCRRKSGNGPCPAPVNGVCDKIDAWLDAFVAELLDGEELDVVTAKRDLTGAERAHRRAQDDYDNFFLGVRGMSSEKIRETLEALEADVQRTAGVLEEAHASAVMADDLPESGHDYLSRPLAQRRRYAAGLVAELILDPFPKGAGRRGANPADRLRWTLG